MAIIFYITNFILGSHERRRVEPVFKALNQSNLGSITKAEFMSSRPPKLDVSSEKIDKMFKNLGKMPDSEAITFNCNPCIK